MAEDDQVLHLGKVIPRTKKVTLEIEDKETGAFEEKEYRFPEISMYQALRLFQILQDQQHAKDLNEVTEFVQEFATLMKTIIPSEAEAVWFVLNNDQQAALIAYLSPFGSATAVRELLEQRATGLRWENPPAPNGSPSTSPSSSPR